MSINNFNEMLGNDEKCIKKLGDVMEYDQAIAVKLLQRIPDGVEVSTLAQIRSEKLRLRLFLLNDVKVDGNTIRDRSYSLANFITKAESS